MVANLDDQEFAEMLAAIWERHGWSTEVTNQEETVMVAGDRPDGLRGVILVATGSEAVGEEPIRQLQELKSEKGVDVPVAATNRSFTQDARELADTDTIYLLDPETLAETAAAEGFEDLLKEYSSGGVLSRIKSIVSVPFRGGSSSQKTLFPSGLLSRLPSSVPGLSSLAASIRSVIGGTGSRPLLLVIGIVAILLFMNVLGLGDIVGGVLGALPVPDFGLFDAIGGLLGWLPLPELSLGGGGYSVTAVSLVDGEAEPLDVEWDTKRAEAIVGPNGTQYEAPENHTFVVVQMNVTNPTAGTVQLTGDTFGFATGRQRYAPQPLEGARGQLPIIVPPLSYNRGYMVFSVPEEAESGTLLALPGPDAAPMDFDRNRDLEYQVSV